MRHRQFIGARLDSIVTRRLGTTLRHLGWAPRLVPFTGYGSPAGVRVLGQLVLTPAQQRRALPLRSARWLNRRGWRNFFALPIPHAAVRISLGSVTQTLDTDRRGYIDTTLVASGLSPGWHAAQLESSGASPVTAPVQVISDDTELGIISDIDDTIITTSLPRPLVAIWNSFIQPEVNRQAVPGMARMYRELLSNHPQTPVIYVSTGPWTALPFLTRFMDRHHFPAGPMLLTDLGPTPTNWLRSGQQHKRHTLDQLAQALPNVSWLLIGDDGQHDRRLYRRFAQRWPGRVRAIAIRTLTPTQQVLAHGTVVGLEHGDGRWIRHSVPEFLGADGNELAPAVLRLLADPADPTGGASRSM